jgi:2,4-dienoyl-CoA reductase-like NADH-dependent reductase (Old Yellow Enzyme family)
MLTKLFQPYRLNDTITLKNRILMAPMTRCMADDNLVSTPAMAAYYARRADTGLIISEATIIRPDGQGYPNTPGIFTPEQIVGWKKITDAVHNNGGKIFLQLWHTGRLAHPFFHGRDALAPSALTLKGTVPRHRELTYTEPKPVTHKDIAQLITDFGQAAKNAITAGFDGVEIHGANGYLLDQFLHYDTNRRTDEFGGTAAKMARFPLAVIDEVIQCVGADRVGLRLSPGAYFNIEPDSRDRQVFDYLLNALESRRLAYLHVGIFDDKMTFDYLEGTSSQYIRAHSSKTLIGVGSYTAETGNQAIAENKFDLLAIGRPLIANPDYVEKISQGETLVPYTEVMLSTLV